MTEASPTESVKPSPSLLRAAWAVLARTKRWWLLPFVVSLLALALLVFVGRPTGSGFNYTLF